MIHPNRFPTIKPIMRTGRTHVTRPRVFALEPWRKLDLQDAERFGDLWYLFPEARQRPSIWQEDFCQATVDALKGMNYNPDVDCILVVGAVANLAIFLCKVAAKFGRIKLLIWCGIEGRYISRHVVG